MDKDVATMLPESMDVQNAPAPTSDKIAFANLATCERSGIGRLEIEMSDRRDERLSQKKAAIADAFDIIANDIRQHSRFILAKCP